MRWTPTKILTYGAIAGLVYAQLTGRINLIPVMGSGRQYYETDGPAEGMVYGIPSQSSMEASANAGYVGHANMRDFVAGSGGFRLGPVPSERTSIYDVLSGAGVYDTSKSSYTQKPAGAMRRFFNAVMY